MFFPGELELRKRNDGVRVVRGRFPYNKAAVLTDGGNTGRPIKERFKPGAFSYRLNDVLADIHLLFGHDYDKPLASKLTNTLSFTDTAVALIFEAIILPKVLETSYARDVLALIGAGLVVGLSPGFRIPPKQTVPDAETWADEDPRLGRAKIRTINEALLYELSIVTRPAYAESLVETVDDEEVPNPCQRSAIVPAYSPAYRWRHV